MGLFSSSDSKRSREISNPDWIELQAEEAWVQLLEKSHQKPQVVFKHSYRCGVSKVAMYELERDWAFNAAMVDMHYLDLLTFRPISNKIAEEMDVTHQSPQVILIKNGKAVYHTSHAAIKASKLRKEILS